MKELFQCTDTIARIRVSPLVARTKKPCRFSHGELSARQPSIRPPSPRCSHRRAPLRLAAVARSVVAELAGYPMEAANA